ncbi:MAG TPA: tannase/feruloyl esterase family alpha/beta hydrolase [Gammaproteobacteria bacterium]|nr:tannase/feruloyl esterase family alpha/beta hydrolase [Gammaproteobacteria bacterium]
MISLLAAAQVSALLNMPCEQLPSVPLERATITSAATVVQGIFTPPRPAAGQGGGPPRNQNADAPAPPPPQPIPEHCRVQMVLKPTPDSNINVDLWLPTQNWNGKFLAVGNGGWAGSIQGYGDMQEALRRGYATAGTDTGHTAADGPNGMFALGHPEKIVDFAYRALHDMTVKSKRLIDVYYAKPLDYSYYKGCSTGGRMGVMAAQRYPGDYDGIIAGALANRHIHMHTAGWYRGVDLARHPDRQLPEAKAKLVNDAVMAKCDVLHEGFLNNPRECSFDFKTLACGKGKSGDMCLTPGELTSVQNFYGGTKNKKGELIFSGQAISVALPAISAPKDPGAGGTFDTVRILGFQNADYDWHNFDLDRDMPLIDKATGFVDAVNPDLRAFEAAGGKLLLYAGWNDNTITPENTVYYYESVLREMGSDQADWMRMFLVPGMQHCGRGPGPNTFDSIATLEQWREKGQAPAQILGKNPQSGLARPICAYPQYAKYKGSGDLKDAANWSCTAP